MIFLSAVLYLMPFIYPHYTYPCLFLWMLPIVIHDHNNIQGFKQGFVWGLIFYSGHLWWLAYILHTKGEHHLRIMAYVCLVLYLSIFSGLWLWGKQQVIHRYARQIKNQQENSVALCLTWLFSTVTFILITNSLSFAIFDCFEGYYLSNPLLPLVFWPWFMRPIFYFGELFYWILLVLINLTFVEIFKKYDSKALIFLILLFSLPAFFQPPNSSIIVNPDEIVYLQPSWNDLNLTSAQKFYSISHNLDEIAQSCSNVKYVVMPESSFAHDLVAWENKLDAWTSLFSATTSIFVGAHRKERGKIFNCLFQIQDGRIIAWHDKQHLVFFTERQPVLWRNIPIFRDLFIPDEFSCSEQLQDTKIHEFQPAICSEIFCGIRRFNCNAPILFACHDAWLGLDYARIIARNAARLCGMKYGVPIVYAGSNDYEILM